METNPLPDATPAPCVTEITDATDPRLARLCMAIACLWLVVFAYFVSLTHIVGPFGDDWNMMYFVKAITEGKVTLAYLFERFYGAQTPALARILFAIEYFCFHGTAIFTKVIALLAVSGTFYFFWKNIEQDIHWTQRTKTLLILLGVVIVFSGRQLSLFNYPLLSFQHDCAIFFAGLAFHLFTRDTLANKPVSLTALMIYTAAGIVASLFTVIGLFCLGALLPGLFIRKAEKRYLVIYTSILVILAYLFRPDLIVHRLTEDVDKVTWITIADFLKIAGVTPQPFFPGFFRYLLAYFGAILECATPVVFQIQGALLLVPCLVLGISFLYKPRQRLLFFQLFLFMLCTHATLSVFGRYQTNDPHFDRFYSAYCWLLWAVCLLALAWHRKCGLALCGMVVISILATYNYYLQQELRYSYDAKKADINMINDSFPHMARTKVSTPLGILGFDVQIFHEFQKKRHWGIYRFPFTPDLSQVTADECEASKLKEFIVSEKRFVEYQLDGWNLSRNSKLDYFYAVNPATGNIVAYGQAMPRSPSYRPNFLLPRDQLMVYAVFPKDFRLTDLQLYGGNNGTLCRVVLKKATLNRAKAINTEPFADEK